MWLFTTCGFYSIVRKHGDDVLTVRARERADLERLRDRYLPELGPILATPRSDYEFRAKVDRKAFGAALERIGEDVDYHNFKDEVAHQLGHGRSGLYHSVWHAMQKLGERPAQQTEVAEPRAAPRAPRGGKGRRSGTRASARVTYGGVVFDGYGRVYVRETAGGYGDYRWSVAKGGARTGETPEGAALREVSQELGVDAIIEAPIPGEFQGETSITSFFLMSLVRDKGDFLRQETSEVRAVDAKKARKLLSLTPSEVGRARDLAVLKAALALRGELLKRGQLVPRAPDRPGDFAGVCTCSLPLPVYCPVVEVASACSECPIAREQDVGRHARISPDDPALVRAGDRLLRRMVRDDGARRELAEHARSLYTRADFDGSALPKAVLFSIYKAGQLGSSAVLTEWGERVTRGDEVDRWPDELRSRGPTWRQMFEVYGKRYEVQAEEQ